MTSRSVWFSLIPVAIAFSACHGPDLVVTDHVVRWSATSKSVITRVGNIGDEGAGPFQVYVTGDEDPVSANHRPQVRHSVSGLAVGASIKLASDFLPLAHPDNLSLANVRRVSIAVDPKNQVAETDETNNLRSFGVGPCVAVQSCLSVAGSVYVGDASAASGPQKVAQTFTVPQDGQLCGIELSLGRQVASTSGELILRVFDGDTLLTTATKSGASIPITQANPLPALDPVVTGIGHFDLTATNVFLASGHSYRFEASFANSATLSIGICSSDYPGGVGFIGHGDEPFVPWNHDLTFKVLMR
ncbi:MAG: hypothetical protein HZB39_09245 [Planctomycetes bacterium]|nr:hypothetical protein [Planctomycetota bacterium]